MQRRSFFGWLASSVLPLIAPRWAFAQAAGAITQDSAATLRALSGVVLPASLGPAGLDAATTQFTTWIQNYKAGAEMSSGYGFTRIQRVGPNPSAGYAAQLRAIEAAASAKGSPFSKLESGAQRAVVEASLEEAKIDRIPPRPDGKHVAADLMSFFFFGSDGQDLLYGARIQRDRCRGLEHSSDRPAPVR
jgi:hypothetical protein